MRNAKELAEMGFFPNLVRFEPNLEAPFNDDDFLNDTFDDYQEQWRIFLMEKISPKYLMTLTFYTAEINTVISPKRARQILGRLFFSVNTKLFSKRSEFHRARREHKIVKFAAIPEVADIEVMENLHYHLLINTSVVPDDREFFRILDKSVKTIKRKFPSLQLCTNFQPITNQHRAISYCCKKVTKRSFTAENIILFNEV